MKRDKNYKESYDSHTAENVGEYKIKTNRKTDIFLFILSFILAFVIWAYVMGVESPAYAKTLTLVPVKIHESVHDLPVYAGYNYTVDLEVQGKKSEIDKITVDEIEAYVDATDISVAGWYTLEIKVNLPNGITLSDRSLTTISICLDNKSSKVIPVKVKLTGYQLSEGYELGESDITTSINEVTVTGPESLLKTIQYAQVTAALGKVSSSLTIAGTLELIDNNDKKSSNIYVKLQTTDVIVNVPVYQYKTVPLEVEYKYGYYNDANAKITISPSSVRIKGEAEILNDIKSIKLTSVDEKKVVTDTITVSIPLPNNVINVDGIDDAVISIKHINTTTKELVVDKINVINPNNFNYELLHESINAILRGQIQYLSHITASDIEATVDLSALNNAAGTISTAVTIDIIGSYKKYVYAIGDYKMSVSIK